MTPDSRPTQPLLATAQVRAGYRSNEILHGIDLEIAPGSIVVLLGHNGAGKTTFVRTVFGLHPLSSGSVSFAGTEMTNRGAAARVACGMAIVPQTGNVFPSLTVRENLQTALQMGSPKIADAEDHLAFALETFPVLRDRMEQRAELLSGGQRQMLGVSLSLVRRPSLLILDEPSIGIAPNLVQRLMESLVTIRDSLGMSILLVDQAVRSALSVADYAYVMRNGTIAFATEAEELRRQSNLWEYF